MKSKRKIIKQAVGLGVVASLTPSEWIKPVVQAVILPAHSQTTPGPGTGGEPPTTPAPTTAAPTTPAPTTPAPTTPAPTTPAPTTPAPTTMPPV